jgi:hypothetical protein
MSIKFEKVILENKELILDSCLRFLRRKFKNRTSEPEKCKRDLGYIINAIITCVYDNSTADIHRIVHAFYRSGKLQLVSTHAEKETYKYLKQTILQVLQKESLLEEHEDLVSDIIDILILKIDEGYDYSQTDYVNRRNYKKFAEDKIPVELEKRCDLVLQETPMQEPQNKFIILKLRRSEEDLKIKKFYCENLFKNTKGEHMIAMYSAPLVYMILPSKNIKSSTHVNIGVHGGSLMSEVLRYGYDFSFVGCTEIFPRQEKKFRSRSRKMLQNRFNIDMNNFDSLPIMCFCIGKGCIDDPSYSLRRMKYKDIIYAPLRRSENERKPPIVIG